TRATDIDPGDMVTYEMHWWGDGIEYDSVLTDTNAVTIPRELQDNMQYFWEVIAMDQTDGISHSEPATFWTDLVPEAPEGFALLSPENDAAGLSDMPSFQWEIADDPDPMDYATYTLQIASDSSFSEVVFETNTTIDVGHELTEALPTDTEYWWRVIATDTDSLTTESETFIFTVGYVSIAEDIALPTEYMLDQNYPNPFNPSTTIRYGLPEETNVSLVIYDVRGQVVQTLESEHQSAGWYDVVWNGHTTDGHTISTGIYFARLVAGDYSQVIKMLYLK
ncbi:MAG: T9SS type A sorting domain-containing protein, partial [Bacteroidetes bacterium]|nr:T9SS type A sorting domain-containing protein [Bacteroidota bacterium]